MSVRKAAPVAIVAVLALVLSSPAFAGKPDRTSPKQPTNLRVTAIGQTSVSVAWDAASDNSSNWWYCVQTVASAASASTRRRRPSRTRRLTPGATYTYTVIAIDANGNRSAPSNAVTFTIPPDTTPPSAPVLSVTAVFPTRISVNWTRPTDNTSQVWTTLLVDGAPYFGPVIGFQGLLIPYLQPSSTHTFKVVAEDRFGNKSESNTVTRDDATGERRDAAERARRT